MTNLTLAGRKKSHLALCYMGHDESFPAKFLDSSKRKSPESYESFEAK